MTAEGGTARKLVASVAERLHSESEAKWVVAHAIGTSPAGLFARLDDIVSGTVADAVHTMTERRAAGEPLQYVVGEWSFRHLEVTVDGRALVPRPETEQVVDVALAALRLRRSETGASPVGDLVAADVGTGTGVIALSLALEGPPGLEVWATDVSSDALALARRNLSDFTVSHPAAAARLHVREGSWFEALPHDLAGRLDLVVSNPPYVSADEWLTLDPVVRDHEPRSALVSGPTGLEALDILVDAGLTWLAPGGSLVLELAPHQAATMAARAERAGYAEVRVHPDLAGRDRVLAGRRPR